jgi:hypothetical protein
VSTNRGGPGGKREGAGRKKGVPNKRSEKAIEIAEKTGIMPLDFALEGMRFHHDIITRERAKGKDADEKVIRAEFAAGRVYASDAAPYLHAKLQAIEHMGKGGGPIEFTDARDRLARLLDGEAVARSEDAPARTAH